MEAGLNMVKQKALMTGLPAGRLRIVSIGECMVELAPAATPGQLKLGGGDMRRGPCCQRQSRRKIRSHLHIRRNSARPRLGKLARRHKDNAVFAQNLV